MAGGKHSVSIVAPFYNEGAGVEAFYSAVRAVIDGVPDMNFEIVCVDDGSCDDTLQRLIALVDRDPRLRVIELTRNFGKEAALTAGLDAAKGDGVIPIDADLQDPPEPSHFLSTNGREARKWSWPSARTEFQICS